MKKLLSVFLVFIMSFSLFSCDKEEETKRSRSKKESSKKEITVINNEYCSVTYLGFNDNPDENENTNCEFSLNFFLTVKEPKERRIYLFQTDSCYINGAYCMPFDFYSFDVSDEHEATLNFDTDALVNMGITEFTDFEITMTVTDIIYSEDGDTDFVDLCTETFHIYPYGEDKVEPYTKVKHVNWEDMSIGTMN